MSSLLHSCCSSQQIDDALGGASSLNADALRCYDGSAAVLMSLIDEKGASSPAVASSSWSQLEALSDSVIEELKRRQYAAGQIIGGRYRLKALLGTGAMGQVFVAENTAIGVET